jgi:hypothetical protein
VVRSAPRVAQTAPGVRVGQQRRKCQPSYKWDHVQLPAARTADKALGRLHRHLPRAQKCALRRVAQVPPPRLQLCRAHWWILRMGGAAQGQDPRCALRVLLTRLPLPASYISVLACRPGCNTCPLCPLHVCSFARTALVSELLGSHLWHFSHRHRRGDDAACEEQFQSAVCYGELVK